MEHSGSAPLLSLTDACRSRGMDAAALAELSWCDAITPPLSRNPATRQCGCPNNSRGATVELTRQSRCGNLPRSHRLSDMFFDPPIVRALLRERLSGDWSEIGKLMDR